MGEFNKRNNWKIYCNKFDTNNSNTFLIGSNVNINGNIQGNIIENLFINSSMNNIHSISINDYPQSISTTNSINIDLEYLIKLHTNNYVSSGIITISICNLALKENGDHIIINYTYSGGISNIELNIRINSSNTKLILSNNILIVNPDINNDVVDVRIMEIFGFRSFYIVEQPINEYITSWNLFGTIVGDSNYKLLGAALAMNRDGTVIVATALNDLVYPPVNYGAKVYKYEYNNWNLYGNEIPPFTSYQGGYASISNDGNIIAISGSNYTSILQIQNNVWTSIGESNVLSNVTLSGDGNTAIGIYSNKVYIWNNILTGGSIELFLEDSTYRFYSASISNDGNHIICGSTSKFVHDIDYLGFVRVFEKINNTWTQKGSDITPGHPSNLPIYFGKRVGITDDGNRIFVSAPYGKRQDGVPTVNNGWVWYGYGVVYEYDGSSWNQLGQTLWGDDPSDEFADTYCLNSTGDILALGSIYDDDVNTNAGIVKTYQLIDNIWELIETFYGVNVHDNLGPLAMNGDGKTLAMAIQKHDTPAVSNAGKINIYSAIY